MPFDYNSFIQGVWTGMRLPRVPGGRQPPVPSGKYILTESGERIITESPVTSDCTIFTAGVDYLTHVENPDNPYRRVDIYLNIERTHAATAVEPIDEAYYFIADNLDPDYDRLVVFGKPDLNDVAGLIRQDLQFTAYMKIVDRDGPNWFSIASGDIVATGDTRRVMWVSANIQRKGVDEWRIPLNTVMWHGTQDELEDFVMSLNPAYMITE